jgi:dolichyl-phosphate beta-glucosyltransferase
LRFRSFTFALSLFFGLSLLYWGVRDYPAEEVRKALGRADILKLFAAFGAMASAYALRAVRWTIWEKGLGTWNAFRLILIGFMGNNLFPARAGELLRAVCSKQKTKPGRTGASALASIVVERSFDGLLLSLLGVAAVFMIPRADSFPFGLALAPLACGLAMATIFGTIRYHGKVRQWLGRLHRDFPGHVTRRCRNRAELFLDGLLPIGKSRRAVLAAAGTLAVWGMEFAAYFLVGNSIAPGFSTVTCLVFMTAVNFASLFPLTIGGIGAVEAAAAALLVRAGVSPGNAMAMVALQHAMQYGFTTAVGLGFYFGGGFYKAPLSRFSRKRTCAAPGEDGRRTENKQIVSESGRRVRALSRVLDLPAPVLGKPRFSIVIPGYNEQNRLPRTLLETLEWCAGQKGIQPFEILIVDDGSEDETLTLARLFSRQVDNVRFLACPHRGKGEAVRMGMLNADGQYVLFMDADGATPLSEIPKLIVAIEGGADIAIGSRVVQNPCETRVVTNLRRKISGRVFSGLVNLLLIPGIADSQCGFKMFRREVIQDLFARQRIPGFAFDVELLFLAKRYGFRIDEVPVNWANQDGSKVNLIVDSVRMFRDILRIRWIHKGERIPPSGMGGRE